MPLLVTPIHLASRAAFYRQLAQLTTAGIGLEKGLYQLRRTTRNRRHRQVLGVLIENLGQGTSFTESLRALGRWVPQFDLSLIDAAEQSGRLDECFRRLAEDYEDRARTARQVIFLMIYPALLFHAGVLIPPFPQLFLTGNVQAYLQQTLGILLPIYLVVFLVLYACQSRRAEYWRSFMELVLGVIPVLGRARRCLALSRLAAALDGLLNAGTPMVNAWELAAAASGSPALHRAVKAWRPDVEAGTTPSEALLNCRAFPELFTNLYHTGEISGSLDESLRQIQRLYLEEGTRKIRVLAWVIPGIIYLVIVGIVAMTVFRGWLSYYDNIFKVLGQ